MAAEERHTETEGRIRTAMAQLLGGAIPEGLKCDVKSLCTLSGVPRATLYRSYPHIRAEFERERSDAQTAGHHPDPRLAQIERLKTEIIDLHKRLNRGNAELAELRTFRAGAIPPHSPARRSHQPPARTRDSRPRKRPRAHQPTTTLRHESPYRPTASGQKRPIS